MQDFSDYGARPRRRGSGSWLSHAMVAVLAAGIAVAVVVGFFSPATGGSQPGSGAVPAPPASAAPLANGQQDIVTKVSPGLVLISTTLQYNSEAAAGTGMVINADGLVLTNNHVIEGSTKITATVISTGKTYQARVVGYDHTGDVALIQLQNASGLTTVPIGNSSSLKAGNAVVALGNAEGQGKITGTAGHITALNTTITASDEAGSTSTETLHGMIETNADIVPGDSGGPLASSARRHRDGHRGQQRGRPARTCRRVRDPDQHRAVGRPADRRRWRCQLRHHDRLPALRGRLHRLRIQQRSADAGTAARAAEWCLRRFRSTPDADSSNTDLVVPSSIAPVSTGTLIDGTICGSPAAAAGISGGAVITAVNGQAVGSPDDFAGIMTRFRPGDTISVTWVSPSGQRTTSNLRLTAGLYRSDTPDRSPATSGPPSEQRLREGQ